MDNSYFCTKCKRKHRKSSSIYGEHLNRQKREIDEVPSNKVLSCNIKLLSYIAQRQIDRYLDKLLWDKRKNFGKNKCMYIQQINKVILHETNSMLTI